MIIITPFPHEIMIYWSIAGSKMHIENFTTDSLYGYMESFMLNDDGPWMFLDDITLCESQISR